MNKFDLTFSGEVLAGYDPEQVRAAFAEIFLIEDPSAVEQLFHGKPIKLRRGLDRKTAADLYSKLHFAGADVALEKISELDHPGAQRAREAEAKKDADKQARADAKLRREAELADAQAKAEERQRQAAKQTELKALEADEKAREKSEKLAAAQRVAEEIAAQKARRVRARKEAAEEAAQQRAQEAETKRQEKAEKARAQAQAKRQKSEEKARDKAQKAEAASRQKAQKQQEKKKAAEESAKQLALKLEQRRDAAADAALQRKELARQKRAADEQAAREKADKKRRHAEEFARLKAQKAAEKARRDALDRAAREKAAQEVLELEALQSEQRRLEAEEVARLQAEKLASLKSRREDQTQEDDSPARRKFVPKSIGRSRSGRAKVRTSLNVPSRARERKEHPKQTVRPSRQPGAPNFFILRPFKMSADTRHRAARSRQLQQIGFAGAVLALAALAILAARYLTLPQPTPINGPTAMVANERSDLILLAGEQLFVHDRSGISTKTIPLESLGLSDISAPMAFDGDGRLWIMARTALEGSEESSTNTLQLMRCQLSEGQCAAVKLPAQAASPASFALNRRMNTLYLARPEAGLLFKLSPEGDILGEATIELPGKPVIRLQSGLIYINSSQAPAISVFRPDNAAFGEQLDEVLLVPPSAEALGLTRVADFVHAGDSWWVTLQNPDTLNARVYRYSTQWDFQGEVMLAQDTHPDQLLGWGEKLLILDEQHPRLQRFNAQGDAEIPLLSDTLSAFVEDRASSNTLTAILWRFALILVGGVAFAALGFGLLHRFRHLVYRRGEERNASPIDEDEPRLEWIPLAGNYHERFRQLCVAGVATALVALILVGVFAGSVVTVIAVVLFFAGPAFAAFLIHTAPTGHIATLGDRLVLVDHENTYHHGRGPQIRYRKHFVLIDDVVVFTGTPMLPVFDTGKLQNRTSDMIHAGIGVDRKTVAIKLLEKKHALARGAAVCLASTAIAALLLAMT